MIASNATSTGHALSDTTWLDTHFQSAQAEYEDSLRYVEIHPGWAVLDAGCGGGGFLPLMAELVGLTGEVIAMDLAPENVAHIDKVIRDGNLPANVKARVGSLLSLPFSNASFDCVWSANVVQYLTEKEFDSAMNEFKRVLRPGGTLAIKDFDDTMVQVFPTDPSVVARFFAARRARSVESGLLGITSGASLSSRFRRAGLTDIKRKGWLVERWAPLSSQTRVFLEAALRSWAGQAEQLGSSSADLEVWRGIGAHLKGLLDDPDFCFREGFVVAVGRVAS